MKKHEFWASSNKITAWIQTDEDLNVIDAAPILKRFIGQPIKNLEKWMKKQGGFKCKLIKPFKDKNE